MDYAFYRCPDCGATISGRAVSDPGHPHEIAAHKLRCRASALLQQAAVEESFARTVRRPRGLLNEDEEG